MHGPDRRQLFLHSAEVIVADHGPNESLSQVREPRALTEEEHVLIAWMLRESSRRRAVTKERAGYPHFHFHPPIKTHPTMGFPLWRTRVDEFRNSAQWCPI